MPTARGMVSAILMGSCYKRVIANGVCWLCCFRFDGAPYQYQSRHWVSHVSVPAGNDGVCNRSAGIPGAVIAELVA